MSKGPFYRFEVYRLDPDTEAKRDLLLVHTAPCGEAVRSDSEMVDRYISDRVKSGDCKPGLFVVEIYESPDKFVTSRLVWKGEGHRIMRPSEHSEYMHPSEQIHKD